MACDRCAAAEQRAEEAQKEVELQHQHWEAAEAKIEKMREVVEAAKAWSLIINPRHPNSIRLYKAVAALEASD